MRSATQLIGVAVVMGGVACAARPRPAILARLDEVRSAPASEQARQWAPQAHAEAIRLEGLAISAFEAGDIEATETLSEGAIAGHEHAIVLARLARAEQRRRKAKEVQATARQELQKLQAQHQRLLSEATAFETRAQVHRAALPVAKLGSVGPKRRLARHRAAGALATQGRLLCVSARLLRPRDEIDETLAALDELETRLAVASRRDNLQDATRLRADCMELLSKSRIRASEDTSKPSPQGRVQPPTDVLLARLSAAGLRPSRDERGVSLPLDHLFDSGDSVSASGLKTLKVLSAAAQRQSGYRLLLVGHAGARGQQGRIEKQLAQIKSKLESEGAGSVVAMNAGMRQPLVPHGAPGSRKRNERLELVFVSPSW